jgi:hypothetical protein
MKRVKLFAKIFHISFGVLFSLLLVAIKEYKYAGVAAILSIFIIINDIKHWND